MDITVSLELDEILLKPDQVNTFVKTSLVSRALSDSCPKQQDVEKGAIMGLMTNMYRTVLAIIVNIGGRAFLS